MDIDNGKRYSVEGLSGKPEITLVNGVFHPLDNSSAVDHRAAYRVSVMLYSEPSALQVLVLGHWKYNHTLNRWVFHVVTAMNNLKRNQAAEAYSWQQITNDSLLELLSCLISEPSFNTPPHAILATRKKIAEMM